MRNLFYYTMKKLLEGLTVHSLSKTEHDLDWNPYQFKWNTVLLTMDHYLKDYIIRANMYEMPSLMLVNLGIWPLLSRPLVDYVLGLNNIINDLRILVEMGTRVSWQPMPALPKEALSFRPDISNHLVAALNYYTCKELQEKAGVDCSVNWRASLAWSSDLICPTNTHTMCFQENFNVLPPGRVSSEQILKNICRSDVMVDGH